MKGLAITSMGIEDITALEIKELLNSKTQVEDGAIIIDLKKIEDLCLLCYKCQSVSRILFLLDYFKLDRDILKVAEEKIKKLDFSKWLDKNLKFAVRCIKSEESKISTAEIEKKFGEYILNNIQNKKNYVQNVDLKNPDIVFLVYISNNKCYFGVDFSGFDLSKRTYKIFMHPASLKGTIAYAAVRISGFGKNKILLDPFTGSGIIPIEAALFSLNFPVNYYNKEKFAFLNFKPFIKFNFEKFFDNLDKKIYKEKLDVVGYDNSMKFVDFARKNAKIAGIDKQISFSRVDVDLVDLKFNKKSVDLIVTDIPILSKNSNKKVIDKSYSELFYQADYILKKNGEACILTRNPDFLEKYFEKYYFKISEKRKIQSGKQEIFIVKLKR